MRFILILLATAQALSAFSQVFMRPFDNAAALAFAGASVAYPGNAAGLHNPAQPGMAEPLTVTAGSAIPYSIPGWTTGQVFAGFPLGKQTGLGLDLAYSGTEIYAEQHARLSAARRLSACFLLGISADWFHIDAHEYGSTSAFTFGVGFLAKALPSLWIGAGIQNPLQQKSGEAVLPTVFRLGACWKPSDLFLLLAETEKDLQRIPQVKAGFEYRPGGKMLLVRAGARSGPARVSFGAGIWLNSRLRLDIGSEWHPALGITPSVMLFWRKTGG